MRFISPTFGEVEKEQVFEFIKNEILDDKKYSHEIIIGTDSQNSYKTKMVSVICVTTSGLGGKFFYNIEWINKIRDLNSKIFEETRRSLELAHELNDFLYQSGLRPSVQIHVDIGKEGKTRNLIQSVVGWVDAEGFTCHIKDDSYVASCIADRLSK